MTPPPKGFDMCGVRFRTTIPVYYISYHIATLRYSKIVNDYAEYQCKSTFINRNNDLGYYV